MKEYKTLILRRDQIQKLAGIKDAIRAIEAVFKRIDGKKTQMPAKIYLHLHEHHGDFRAMPAFVDSLDRCALKWVNVHPRNARFGLPAVMAIIILSDPENGFPLCIMDGTYATSLRTGAMGGVAAKYLARRDSGVIGLIGCGVQAKTQLLALNELFKVKEVRVWDCGGALARDFARDMRKTGLKIRIIGTVQECVRGCDIVVTTTPSRVPLVKLKWLKIGAHINAIGADARGKEELEPAVLKNAKVVVDSWEQASHSGEINVPLARGIITRKDIYADIGQIISRRKKARANNSEITVFDSTGLAIQDTAIADLIYRKALKKKIGEYIKII